MEHFLLKERCVHIEKDRKKDQLIATDRCCGLTQRGTMPGGVYVQNEALPDA